MIVLPATVEHARAIRDRLQPMQAVHATWLDNDDQVRALFAGGPAFAGVDEGKVLALAGVIDQSGGVGRAWAWLSQDIVSGHRGYAGRKMLAVHGAVARFLDVCEFRRVELFVALGFRPGCTWAHRLGFEWECLARGWMPSGGHANQFARVRWNQ